MGPAGAPKRAPELITPLAVRQRKRGFVCPCFQEIWGAPEGEIEGPEPAQESEVGHRPERWGVERMV